MPTAKKNLGGRPSIYSPKNPKKRYQGLTTTAGARAFERARQYLKRTHKVARVSDGDVFDHLAEWWEKSHWSNQ
jgi:hypothetical protein